MIEIEKGGLLFISWLDKKKYNNREMLVFSWFSYNTNEIPESMGMGHVRSLVCLD